MMPKKYKVIITDTSCFSLLQKLGALHLLQQLFPVVITTPEIAREFKHPLPSWVTIQSVVNQSLKHQFMQYIDIGEASAIALASEISFDFLILDDSDARKFAEKLGMPVKGTIGLLVIAKNKDLIPLLKPYFDHIQQTNFRIAQSLLDTVLRDAGE
jgi:predicted nucleic acid-binding protein